MDTEKTPEKPTPESLMSETEPTEIPNNQPEPEAVHIHHAHKLIYGYIALLVVAALAGIGGYWYHHHNAKQSVNNASATVSKANTGTKNTQQYLDIKEWGVRLPLSSSISDAYYVASTSSKDSNSQPNTMWLGLKSLDSKGCAAAQANTGGPYPLALLRVDPTATDPVSGTLYTTLDPNGVTIKGYFYAYHSGVKGKTCASQTQLDAIDAAFKAAANKIVADPNVATNPYAGWKTYTSKLTGATMKYPSSWTGSPSPYTMVANNGATYETMTLSSPYVSFEGQQVGAQIIFETGSSPGGCDASRNDSVYKTIDFSTQGNLLSAAQLINQSGKIYFLQLISTANLTNKGTVIPNCSEQVKLAGGQTLDVTAEFVTPCAPGSHCADVINPLTPQQYNDYPLVDQVVKAFESVTFN